MSSSVRILCLLSIMVPIFLASMNNVFPLLSLNDILDSDQVKWNNEGSFLNDAHKDLRADYILANPPFNDSDWKGDLLKNDVPYCKIHLA